MKMFRKTACVFLVVIAGAGVANQAAAEDKSTYSGPASPFLAAFLLIKAALASEHAHARSIAILSPAKNATLGSETLNQLEFNFKPSSRDNHVKIFVDNEEVVADRKVSRCPCKVNLPKLEPGEHTITLKEATAQKLTGVQGSVKVIVKEGT